MDLQQITQLIAIWALPILFAITLHEAAHGYMAHRLGDSTAYMLGRVTLNPVKHIDLVGTILVPILLLVTTGFVFGWAKPVPVNFRNLNKPRRDMALVAVVGPLSNLAQAFIWLIVLKIGLVMLQNQIEAGKLFALMGQAGIIINLILMALNLIPIPPLDGSRVLSAALPPKLSYYFDRGAFIGLGLVILLAVTGILGKILLGPVQAIQRFMIGLIA